MEITVRPADAGDLDAVAALYDAVGDSPAAREHGPRWRRGVYPLRAHAEAGLAAGGLLVAETGGQIAGTAICLRGHQEEAYRCARWQIPFDAPVSTLHTFAVHPAYWRRGVGSALLSAAETLARREGAQALRLDTYADNAPAIRLYERCGYVLCGIIDLGIEPVYGLKWFRAYEKLL